MDNYNIKNSHDKLFRETWSDKENAKSFLANYLPENIIEVIDLNTLEISKDSFIEKDLKEFYSDILYKTNIRGRTGYIYLLFEHKSYYEKWIHLQLLEYMVKIWRQEIKNNNPQKLSIIIPMVLYHGKYKWSADTNFSAMFIDKQDELREFLPEFKFVLHDLNNWSDDEIKGTIMTKAVILLFKHIFRPDLRDKLPEIFALFKDLEQNQTGLQYLESLIRYLLSNIDEIEINELKTIVNDSIDENKGDFIMSIAEKLIQEGMEKGVLVGRQEAMHLAINLVLAVFDKFGQNSKSKLIVSMIKDIHDPAMLNKLEKDLKSNKPIDDFQKTVEELSGK